MITRAEYEALKDKPWPGAVSTPEKDSDKLMCTGLLTLDNPLVAGGTILLRAANQNEVIAEANKVARWFVEIAQCTNCTITIGYDERGYGWLSPKMVVQHGDYSWQVDGHVKTRTEDCTLLDIDLYRVSPMYRKTLH